MEKRFVKLTKGKTIDDLKLSKRNREFINKLLSHLQGHVCPARLGEKFEPSDLEFFAKFEHKPIDEDYRRFAERFFRRLDVERRRASQR